MWVLYCTIFYYLNFLIYLFILYLKILFCSTFYEIIEISTLFISSLCYYSNLQNFDDYIIKNYFIKN